MACDSHYDEFLGKLKRHKNIIYTYGHSIENSMYCSSKIENIIRSQLRNNITYLKKIDKWKKEFIKRAYPILLYDIANQINKKPINLGCRSCVSLLVNQNSHMLDKLKIQEYIEKFKDRIPIENINRAENLLKKSKKNKWFHLRGHFLTAGVKNIINSCIKETKYKNQINQSIMYSLFINFDDDFKNNTDIKLVLKKIKRLTPTSSQT